MKLESSRTYDIRSGVSDIPQITTLTQQPKYPSDLWKTEKTPQVFAQVFPQVSRTCAWIKH